MKALCLLISASIWAAPQVASGQPREPGTPSPVREVLLAQPFTLAEGYRSTWSKDHSMVKSGTLVVLRVDPELVRPRNAAEPVLYAGNRTVERLNHGHESGHVIGIIPGDVDLTRDPIWFGSPDLPERATAETIRSERATADEAKIEPFSARNVERVTRAPVQAANLAALLRDYAANLVLEYSPQERALARKWRLPEAGDVPEKH